MQTKQQYPTDLNDSQWNVIREMLPKAKPGGRPRSLEMREVVNGILYLVVGGIQWRLLPKEYPKWTSVYHYFREWQEKGLWKRIHDILRARVREKAGRHKHPTAACIDSQSVEMTLVAGLRGYDAGKHVMGRKRHILVDTLGLVLGVLVTAASVSDPAGARQLLSGLGGFCKNLRKVWADGTYRGALLNWVATHFRFRIEAVVHPKGQKGFQVLPRRWVVERTFAWLDANRRLSKDYEVLTDTSVSIIYIAMTRLLLRRLAPA